MKKLISPLLLAAAALLIIGACKKDTTNNTPQPPAGYSKKGLKQLFSPLQPGKQSFTVTAGTHSTIVGAAGTKLTFYPNSFLTATGQPVTSGTVQIQLIEATRIGSMIGARAITTAGGKLLRSGGEVYISATMNGQALTANKYGVGFKQAGYSSQPMGLYVGNANNEDSVVTWDGPFTGNGTTSNGTITDSLQGPNGWYHQFDSCTSFNWINCDYFYNSTATLTNVSAVTPDTSFNVSNTSVFLVFPSINSVTYMGTYATGSHTFSLNASYFVPVGMNVHLVGISAKNGNLYYGELLNQTTTASMSVPLPLQQQTLSYIQSHLAAL